MAFKLTYATMFDPPPALHEQFEAALATVKSRLGRRHAMLIGGEDHLTGAFKAKASPIDRSLVLGEFTQGTAADAGLAIEAAARAFPAWRSTPWPRRLAVIRRAAEIVEERVYEIGAALALEVGKNRLEALAEVQEVADFCRVYADELERHDGFDRSLPDDPVPGWASHNRSVLKPYGAWLVVTPYNFPFALAGGPVSAALVAGNTVVLKGASETPWSGRLLAECFRDAGIPPGVFNYVIGPGGSLGQALIDHPKLAGVTFTGSHETGMHLIRSLAARRYPRPVIAEMGGKNAVIVTASADLERAVLGIARSAFGLSGQKCSAASRIYVERGVAEALKDGLVRQIGRITVGDPTRRENWMGPVATEAAYHAFARHAEAIEGRGGTLLAGGRHLGGPGFDGGLYCAPTLAEASLDDPLWREELFLPFAMIAAVDSKEQALALANDSELGLTAGFYGSNEECAWFFERIEAGVTYANRPQGATTGAWPGYQPFGGWKGSGNTGKAIASFYYLPLYLREQSQTFVE